LNKYPKLTTRKHLVATILRHWSYRYQCLYDGISRLAALGVRGEARLRQLAMLGLTIHADTKVLDLCFVSGQATQFLVKVSQNLTGVDASTLSLKRAQQNVP
jgi:demethylmenaquinone methyltransferase/2-methoxy-6-polyprenyl-1,4-benzoquinol methylase